jgi:hypothetical protein
MARGVRLTNQDRLIVLGLTLFFFFGIFLVGRGFTGMYLIDFQQGKVCCNFYKENSGVCEQQSNCKAIEQITMDMKQKITTDIGLAEDYKFTEEDKLAATKQISSHLEKPLTKNNYASILVGAILLILGIIWIIYLKKE